MKRGGLNASCSRKKSMESAPAKFHSDGNTAVEGSFVLELCDPVGSHIWQGRVGGRHEARCNGASRFGEANASCNSSGQASEVGRTFTAGRCETSERRGSYVVRSVTMLVNYAGASVCFRCVCHPLCTHVFRLHVSVSHFSWLVLRVENVGFLSCFTEISQAFFSPIEMLQYNARSRR